MHNDFHGITVSVGHKHEVKLLIEYQEKVDSNEFKPWHVKKEKINNMQNWHWYGIGYGFYTQWNNCWNITYLNIQKWLGMYVHSRLKDIAILFASQVSRFYCSPAIST